MKYRKWGTLLGGFLINFCIGIPFLFGNLITYVIAYMHDEGLYDEDDIGSDIWILGMFNGSLFITMSISGFMVNKLGYRITLFISNLIFTSGYLFSYLSVQSSIWSTVVCYGLICGFGAGISYVTTIDLISKWFPKHVATVSAVLVAGFSTGGTVFNSLVSVYVNPQNLSPDEDLGSLRVFNQTEVLERVPNIFLLLGGIVFILQLFGSILSFTPPGDNYEEFKNGNDQSELKQTDENQIIIDAAIKKEINMTPLQVLKDPATYVLWMIVFSSLTSLMGIQSSYKNFGQTFIGDDHFLATLGATAAMLAAIYKLLVAYVADITSTKIVFMVNMLVSAILMLTVYHTNEFTKGWYFFWVCVLYCGLSSTLVLSPSVIRTIWGSVHFSTNFAIIWTAVSLSGIGCPIVIDTLLKVVGWQNMFYILGAIASIGFVFSIFLKLPFFPHRSEKSHASELQTQNSQ